MRVAAAVSRSGLHESAVQPQRQRTVLSCFAADHLAAGPVAQATLPYALPLGLHGAFVKA